MYSANDLQARKGACHYDEFKATARSGKWVLTGKNNEALGGTRLLYDDFRSTMRRSRAFFNLGTVPATYTLSIIEAAMTGLPILTPNYEHPPTCPVYSVPRIFSGACVVGSLPKLNRTIDAWLKNGRLARRQMSRLSEKARRVALQEFGIDTIRPKWRAVVEELVA
jgi:glycosyltransferase involved in cell wall biosynthesis